MARTVNHEQRRRRREAITAAAAELFAHRGFAATTTAEIAAAAGISTGSMFYYFPDKRAIFRSIFERDAPESRRLFETHRDADDPLAALLEVVSGLAAPARDDTAPGLLVELLRQAGEDPELMEVVGANEAIMQDGLAALLERAAGEGIVDRELDVNEAAEWIRTIIDAVYLNAGSRPGGDPLPMLRLIVARFVGAESAAHRPECREEP